jgi:MFS family permease
LAIALFYLAAFLMLTRLKNDFPEPSEQTANKENRYAAVIRLGWMALLPSFIYGYLEVTLNVNFPVYAIRSGITPEWVSIILPAFVVGSLALQMPLGKWSDLIGRKKVMMLCAAVGGGAFAFFPLAGSNVWMMMALLTIAGAAVGSFYSLGLAFSADILPSGMVPTAGIIASMNFSAASILAPNINGYMIGYLWPGSMFVAIGALLGMFTLAGFFFQSRPSHPKAITY